MTFYRTELLLLRHAIQLLARPEKEFSIADRGGSRKISVVIAKPIRSDLLELRAESEDIAHPSTGNEVQLAIGGDNR